MLQPNAYTFFVLISAVFSGAAAVFAWNRRPSAGASYLAAILMSVTIWSFGYAMELANTEKQSICFWLRFEYLGIASLPLFCLLFGFRYAGLGRWLTPGNIAAMSAIPAITLLLNWTNEWHGLFYARVDLAAWNGMALLKLDKGTYSRVGEPA